MVRNKFETKLCFSNLQATAELSLLNMSAQYSYEWGQTDKSANTSLMNARHSVVISISAQGNLEIQKCTWVAYTCFQIGLKIHDFIRSLLFGIIFKAELFSSQPPFEWNFSMH